MLRGLISRVICLLLLYILIFTMSNRNLFAQEHSEVKGKVVDSVDNAPLSNVSITILRSKDSILINSTRTKEDGSFSVKSLSPGNYLLSVSHLQYTAYKTRLNVTSAGSIPSLELIKLEKKSIKLEEVLVKSKKIAAITLKGDTLEFQADSFKVRENARVEDLLRQFPNFEVDKKGNITANGEKVKRVLLEGEEFFGDDPTLVTKNIRADIVEKIQLYDGDSEQTELGGNNFGKKEKTVNVTLKANKKNGYFGKMQITGGAPKIYDSQAMLNSFSSKRKLAGYGILSNNGITGLGWEDKSNFSNSEFGIDELDGGGGNFGGKGIPTVKTGGAHFDENFVDKKYYINANYKIADYNTRGFENSTSENIQPDNSFTRFSKEEFNTNNLRNKADLRIKMALDSANTFNLFLEGMKSKNNAQSVFSDSSVRQSGIKMNESQRDIYLNGKGSSFNGFFVWNRKFSQESSISIRLNTSNTRTEDERNLYAKNIFYNLSAEEEQLIKLNERRFNTRTTGQYGGKIAYINQFGKTITLISEYELSSQQSDNSTEIFNIDSTSSGFHNAIKYRLKQNTHKLRSSFEYSKAHIQVKIAPGVELNQQDQEDFFDGNNLNRKFVNWYPNFETKYIFRRKNRILFSYNGSTIQPNINQVQPMQINDDPLNVFVGNPSLKPAFKQSFNLNYRDYILMEDKTILLNGLYAVEQHSIVPKITTDSVGKSIYEFANLSDIQQKSFDSYLIYSFRLSPVDIKINSDIGYGFAHTANYINEVLNENKVQRLNFSLKFSKRNPEKYDISILFNTKYNTIKSSLDENLNSKYWTYLIVPELLFYPSKRYELSLNSTYDYQEPINIFSNKLERFIINFSTARSFFKNQSLVVRVSANDILNQNKGFSRSVNNNLIVENTYSAIGRNFSLGLLWEINKMGN
ncbi:outer membrane beta-barrel protein [Sphingobacterium prati]